jgi:predicted XRE-type DNA-binding protein
MRDDDERGGGDVFADLGFRNSEQELLKAKLTLQIYHILRERRLTRDQAAELLGATWLEAAALMRCKPAGVSLGALVDFLTLLGGDVEVTVKPAESRQSGHMSVILTRRVA